MNLPSRLFNRIWRGLRRRIGLRGMGAILLLATALAAVEAGLASVIGGPEPEQAAFTSYFTLAVAAGWLTVRKPGWIVRLAAWILLGATAVFLTNAGLWDELFDLGWAAFRYAAEWVELRLERLPLEEPASLTPLRLAWLRMESGVRIELDVLRTWLAGWISGQPSLRGDAVGSIWGELMWLLGLFAGLAMRWTGSAPVALLPGGIVLAVSRAHTGSPDTFGLSVFLLAGLLLAALQAQYSNERRWASRGMMYPEDMRMDFTIAASLLVGGIMTLAYVVPQLELGTAIRELVDRAADPGEGSAGGPNEPGETPGFRPPATPPPFFEGYQAGGLPRSHLLGAGPELADEVALTARVFGEPDPAGARFYWRGLSYDIYTGAGWETGETGSVRYQAGWQVPRAVETYTRPVRQEIDLAAAQTGLAYAAGEVLTADRTYTVAWRSPGPGVPDVFGVRIESERYTIDSSYPYFFSELLRAAGTEYPDWVTGRYLGLPESVPGRVRELAASLAGEAGNAYDAGLAIERYLRRFEYTLELGPPPAGVDLADYFLFDLQRGYCDYFATAMVVLARSAGIPARLAVGYAGGEYDPESERYVVSSLNAHSWPELYFPGFGWVPFEPTSGVAAIERSEDSRPLQGSPSELPPLQPAPPAWLEPAGAVLGLAAAAAVVAAGLRALRESVRIRRLDPEAFFSEAFQWVYEAGRRLGVETPRRPTPLELDRAFTGYMGSLRDRNSLARRFPPAGPDLARLTDAYVRMLYAAEPPGETEKEAGIRSLGRLRRIVLIARIEQRFSRS